MITLKLENFRCLKDTGFINIKPLTILLGSNSSGKSSFLRFFPLVKQSINKNIRGPLLWAGDDEYVDFGSFDETLYRESEDNSIDITFKTSLEGDDLYYIKFLRNRYIHNSIRYRSYDINSINICVKLSIKSNNNSDYIQKLCIDIFKKSITIYMQENGEVLKIAIDGIEINDNIKSSISFVGEQGSLIPVLHVINNKDFKQGEEVYFDSNNSVLISKWFEKKIASKKLSKEQYQKLALESIDLVINECKNVVEELKNNTKLTTISNKLGSLSEEEGKELVNLVIMVMMQGIMASINNRMRAEFQSSFYIAPLRAEANRYYRIKNISTQEIDYQGKNIAVLLNSLSNKDAEEFQEWMLANFHFCPVIDSKEKGHLTIKIKDRQSGEYNLADTGFGYSQILPIAVQLWLIIKNKIKARNNFLRLDDKQSIYLLIEQPELHLHPAMQAKFTDLLISSLKEVQENNKLFIIIETHSETIINRIGKNIAKDKLAYDDVNVVLFIKEEGEKATTIDYSKFDKKGFLRNWPLGFMLPEDL